MSTFLFVNFVCSYAIATSEAPWEIVLITHTVSMEVTEIYIIETCTLSWTGILLQQYATEMFKAICCSLVETWKWSPVTLECLVLVTYYFAGFSEILQLADDFSSSVRQDCACGLFLRFIWCKPFLLCFWCSSGDVRMIWNKTRIIEQIMTVKLIKGLQMHITCLIF